MSPLSNGPQPDDLPVAFRDIVFGILIGAAAWLVRYLCSPDKYSMGYILRRTATAGLASLLVGLATKGYFASEGIAFAAAGCAGYAAPELWDALLARARALRLKSPSKGD